ncbi:hypothetical protein KXQ82_06990 [Mucilaginibacter sp. HMF5004]|uniref:hypothetical protein n=1 Tax=Mucilaginibacter rivuli TaxID=2857527 RepID=UPI001C5DB370|nr:hypothetical protein [Mucilaginibacter rivuli]MBW4889452.1 hypothetical protein [Mucilaginibacter rivuli]
MKNSIKLGALALALTVSFAACSGTKKTDAADSTKIADSIKAADSAKMAKDTTKMDTTKKDTTKKM